MTFAFCVISTTIVVCADVPVARTFHAMIYDSVNDRVIIYGGTKGTTYDDWRHDMWEYDYNTDTWTIIDKTNRPFGRYSTDMVYDSESNTIVSFGGSDVQDVVSNETWLYDYATEMWTEADPSTFPIERNYHTMTYDSESDRVIMFGGELIADASPTGENQLFNDTWAYDVNLDIWTNITPAVSPLPRMGCDMAYDIENDMIIMFGGYTHLDPTGFEDEVWSFDYNTLTWTEMNPTVELRRRHHKMVYDSESDLIVLFGGSEGNNPLVYLDETWVYDFNADTWTMMTGPEETSPTDEGSLLLYSVAISIGFLATLAISRRKKKN
ncbi:MAG: Kelch repeat-containing protein [Candidatus Heimdallarchaeaceae archaeon]